MDLFDKIMVAFGFVSIFLSLLIRTTGIPSAIVFKAVPFFSGVYTVFYVLLLNNIITIN